MAVHTLGRSAARPPRLSPRLGRLGPASIEEPNGRRSGLSSSRYTPLPQPSTRQSAASASLLAPPSRLGFAEGPSGIPPSPTSTRSTSATLSVAQLAGRVRPISGHRHCLLDQGRSAVFLHLRSRHRSDARKLIGPQLAAWRLTSSGRFISPQAEPLQPLHTLMPGGGHGRVGLRKAVGATRGRGARLPSHPPGRAARHRRYRAHHDQHHRRGDRRRPWHIRPCHPAASPGAVSNRHPHRRAGPKP